MGFSPWYFCKEASNALHALASSMNTAEQPTFDYLEIERKYRSVCPDCLSKLPEISEIIQSQTLLTQSNGCCGVDKPCDLLNIIEQLRPVTPSKMLDDSWWEQVFDLNEKICCLIQKIQQEKIETDNTLGNIREIPNFTTKGLPGFKYPNYRIPPLWKLKIKPNNNVLTNYGFAVAKGLNFKYNNVIGNDYLNIEPDFSFNANGISSIFGAYFNMYNVRPMSPLKMLYDLVCNHKLKLFPTFSGKVVAKVMPNFNFNPHININVDPCIAKLLPPMANPVNKINSLKLGDGEEFGFYDNFKLEQNNFGLKFDGNSSFISPLVKSSKEITKNMPLINKESEHGLENYIDKIFPSYDKGSGWSKH